MLDWNFSPDLPVSLPLSADARLSPTDYTNDQIWELSLGNSEPPAITLQTTFGLRARFCRIFPRFIYNDQVVSDPARFHHPITIHRYFPNYLSLSFKPFSYINVILEYWVPDSHTVAGRAKIRNTGHSVCQIQIEWADLLVPAPDGHRMAIHEQGLATVLAGDTANLVPVFFLIGGAQPGKSPYPALNLSLTIPPNDEQNSQWVQSSLTEIKDSYEQARDLASKNWDAEFTKILRINANRLQINTGNHDWDTALYMSQTLADQLLLQPTELCRSASFVNARNPDQGYSLLNDGTDYNHLWNGQAVLDSYYLMNFLLPTAPNILKGILNNYLDTQLPTGEIDLKPGLGGQRSQFLAPPLIALMTWKYFEFSGDIDYLKSVFPKLLSFFFCWFSDSHDRDQDLIPEWEHLTQTGFEERPQFSFQDNMKGGADISTVECPDLCSYLFRECQSLIAIAQQIAASKEIDKLKNIAAHLKLAVEEAWSDNHVCYMYRDRDSHISTISEHIGKRNGAGIIEVNQEYSDPVRLLIHVKSSREGTRPVQIYIHGSSSFGTHRVDHIPTNQIHWHLNSAYFTSVNTYKSIDHIEVTGILPEDEIYVQTPGLTELDQTLLLPLWAGIPSEDKAKVLINLTIMNKKKFLSPYGLRSRIYSDHFDTDSDVFISTQLSWIAFILEGMIQYGERLKAAELFTRSMNAIIPSFRDHLTFHKSYNSETGQPQGMANSINGLIPVGVFLDILGVRIISPNRVEISGNNSFPWPVTLKYRGLTVVHQEKKSLVIFSDGQNMAVNNDSPQVVSKMMDN